MSTPSVRRDRLLETAASLFARWGFDKTSVDDIARETGVSKGAVYLEFPNKDELFRAVLLRESLRHSEDWTRRFREDRGEWSFARMFEHSMAAANENPLMKALLTRDQRFFGSFLRRDPELFSFQAEMGEELFRELQKHGAMRDDIPAPVIARMLSMIGYGLVAGDEVLPEARRLPFDETVRALGLLLDRGLAPKRAQDRRAAKPLLLAAAGRIQEAMRRAMEGERRAA